VTKTGRKDQRSPFSLALIATPWHLCNRPSIQLGSLKAYLEREAEWISVHNMHPYLQAAKTIGPKLYQAIAANMWLSEALFTPALFPHMEDRAFRLARSEAKRDCLAMDPPRISKLLTDSLSAWIDSVNWQAYDLIGFSVCFHQLLSSLFAAKRIKQRHPAATLVFGGSSILAGMETSLRELAGVDYSLSGEGELALLRLCRRLSAEQSAANGRVRHGIFLKKSDAQLAQEDLATPDYDDFFFELGAVFPDSPFIPLIPVEFSRGCWWNKCTFCNLNLQWRGYRRKSAERMRKEISHLAARHKSLDFTFTDNSLPISQGRLFFELMSKERLDPSFFAELRVEHVKDLSVYRSGGLQEAQMGIEALSDSLLARMHKGVRVMDNVYAMKRANELGICLFGNLILEFPGSTDQERNETLAVLDYVFPYEPLAAASFFLGQGSPICEDEDRFGLQILSHHHKFGSVLPLEVLKDLPLLVRGYRGDKSVQRRRWLPVRRKMLQWRQFHEARKTPAFLRPLLSYRLGENFLIIRQEMMDGKILNHRLTGTSREIYLFCREPVHLMPICNHFPGLTKEKIEQFLQELQRKRLVFHGQDRYLALAVHGE
jgi:ribosomal peptide maturation radical SAM protein 1